MLRRIDFRAFIPGILLAAFLGATPAAAAATEVAGLSAAEWQAIERQIAGGGRGSGSLQQAYVKASNADPLDFFGYSLAIDGDTLVVGAPYEDSSATGAGGNQSDNDTSESGAVYVFVRSGGVWTQQAYLKASNPDLDDIFGSSVALDGDTLVVGAPGEASSATGVGGNQADNSAIYSGAAYVFVRLGTNWSQQAYLKASNTAIGDLFGISVAIAQDLVVVGASGEDSDSGGVNGNQGNNSASASGAAYVFSRSGNVWSQEAYIKASDPGTSDDFGESLALDGNTLAVGAKGEGNDSGAAYVFVRGVATWTQQALLKAANAQSGDHLGASVAIYANTVVAGAPGEDSSATGVDGPANELSPGSGAAYVFRRLGVVWTQQAYLKASNTQSLDEFGSRVAVFGNKVAVAAIGEDSAATGIGGDAGNNAADGAGAVFLFQRFGATWSQLDYFKASNTDATDRYGFSLDLEGSTLVAGADWEDGGAGVGGDQGNVVDRSGAAYVYLVPSTFTQLAVPASTATVAGEVVRVPVSLSSDGAPVAGVSFSLEFDPACLDPDLNNDSIPDFTLWSPLPGFTLSALHGEPGRVDFSIADVAPPIALLPDDVLVQAGFLATCTTPPPNILTDTPLEFSALYPPSFSDDFGQDIEGGATSGTVRIWDGLPGDCNASGNLTVGDLISVGLEIFDGDGDFWIDSPSPSFFGNPVGCDANRSTRINAADITCANRLLFGFVCGPDPGAGENGSGPSPGQPQLQVSSRFAAGIAWVGAELDRRGHPVGSLAFSLLLDAEYFELAAIDQDLDGRPDLVSFPLGPVSLDLLRFTPGSSESGGGGRLDILLADLSQLPLPDGLVLEIGIPAGAAPPLGALDFAPSPQPSFGSTSGVDIPGMFTIAGAGIFADGFESGDLSAWPAAVR